MVGAQEQACAALAQIERKLQGADAVWTTIYQIADLYDKQAPLARLFCSGAKIVSLAVHVANDPDAGEALPRGPNLMHVRLRRCLVACGRMQ